MSKPRTFLSFTTVCSAALIAARLAVWMFPMQAPAQSRAVVERSSVVADGPGVAVEPGAKLLHRSPVFYPSGVTTTGSVVVESSVNAKGEVTDAHVLSGPDDLRHAALSSVLNWHFSPDGGLPPTVQSVIRFETAPSTNSATMTAATAGKSSAPRASLYLKSINVTGLSDELAEKVRAGLPVHVGDAFGNDQIAQVRAALKEIDEHLMYGIRNSPPDAMLTVMLRPSGVIGGVIGGVQSGVIEGVPGVLSEVRPDSAPVAMVSIPNPLPGVTRVRVGGNVAAANLIRKVIPTYPPLAKQARIQGTVRFTAIIGTDGNVISLQLVEGHPLLVEAAKDAVSQWQYQPVLLNGNAVQVITQIDVNFTLSE